MQAWRTLSAIPGERVVPALGKEDTEHHHHGTAKGLLPRLLGGVCNQRPQAPLLDASAYLDVCVQHEEQGRDQNDQLSGDEAGDERAVRALGRRWWRRRHRVDVLAAACARPRLSIYFWPCLFYGGLGRGGSATRDTQVLG